MGEERAQKATSSATQTRHEVVQNNLRNVVGGSAVARNLFASLKTTQLWEKIEVGLHMQKKVRRDYGLCLSVVESVPWETQ